MNLETNVSEELWRAIRTTYENKNYTGAIQDAVYFLSDRLREKSDLEGDGQSLVGEALGGENPRLKVTRLESETEWSIQRGTEFLLRGIYAAIRNPRSHEKHADSKQDADSIISFIDYLLRVIGASKAPFNISEFMERVLDPDFVETQEYGELLVDEIPRKKRLEVAFRTYREKEKVTTKQLRIVIRALLKKLSEEAAKEFFRVVTEELKSTTESSTIRAAIRSLPPEKWPEVGRIARIRIENKLFEEIKDGRYDSQRERCLSGSLGTWTQSITKYIERQNRLGHLLIRKLTSGNSAEQNYVFNYFFHDFRTLLDSPPKALQRVVLDGLQSGDKRFYDGVSGQLFWTEDDWWGDEIEKAMDNFQESEPEDEFSEESLMGGDDDLPF